MCLAFVLRLKNLKKPLFLWDDFPYQRRQLYLTRAVWEPVFEPDASVLAAIGDGLGKINQAVPGYIGKNALHDLTGIAAES